MCYYYLVKYKKCKQESKHQVKLFHHKCTERVTTKTYCPQDTWTQSTNTGSVTKNGECPECE